MPGSLHVRMTTDFLLGDAFTNSAAPGTTVANTPGAVAFVNGAPDKASVNFSQWGDGWLSVVGIGAGASSVILTMYLFNPNIGPLSAGLNPQPAGAWVPYKLNAGAAIASTNGIVFEVELPDSVLAGKTGFYLQQSSLAFLTSLLMYLRVRSE